MAVAFNAKQVAGGVPKNPILQSPEQVQNPKKSVSASLFMLHNSCRLRRQSGEIFGPKLNKLKE